MLNVKGNETIVFHCLNVFPFIVYWSLNQDTL